MVRKQFYRRIGNQQKQRESQHCGPAIRSDIGSEAVGQWGVQVVDREQGKHPCRQREYFLDEAPHEADDRAEADQDEFLKAFVEDEEEYQ